MFADFKDLLRNNADELSKVNDAYKEMRIDYSVLQRFQKEYDTYLLQWKDVKIAKDRFLSELKAFLQSLTEKSVNVSCEPKYRNFEECSKKLISFLEPNEGMNKYEVHTIKTTSFRYAVDIFSIALFDPFIVAFNSLIRESNWLDEYFPSVIISKIRNNTVEYIKKMHCWMVKFQILFSFEF